MKKIIRVLKHLIRGERKVVDNGITYGQFDEFVQKAGRSLRYKVRAGRGHIWLEQDTNVNSLKFMQNFFMPDNTQVFETEFHGNYQVYVGKENETHYANVYLWLRGGNMGPKGVKSHEGTVYFTVKRGGLERKVN
ncbi:hypothetical protein J4229_02005 [Candidatus Pacearchaeota archaeon]|nr:hypothetical protein [Candidatus Pacearchaeota archaeon]